MDKQELSPETKVPENLIASLREGIAVVQMIFFKELKTVIQSKQKNQEPEYISMLCGAVTNEIFGTPNTEERFLQFTKKNKAAMEQLLLTLKDDLAHLRKPLTDALRMQVLCDHQQNIDSVDTLTAAEKMGILVVERELPLPSTFMTIIRDLGKDHGLIIPPVQINPEEEQKLVH